MKNDSLESALARLEQATSPETGEPLDEETALLRESWQSFGRLLAAADEQLDRPAPHPVRARDAGWSVRFTAGLAASLLIALAAWALNRGSDAIGPSRDIAAPTNASTADSGIARITEPRAAGQSLDAVDEYAWEDSFDEQLAATSQAIRSVQAAWSGGDQRYSVLLDQFEEFTQEMSEGSL